MSNWANEDRLRDRYDRLLESDEQYYCADCDFVTEDLEWLVEDQGSMVCFDCANERECRREAWEVLRFLPSFR